MANAGEAMCRWVYDEWDALWAAGCGKDLFQFTEAGPDENHFRFCPYCGKRLDIIIPSETESEEQPT